MSDPPSIVHPMLEGIGLQVRSLEALDGTPIVDVKPVLRGIGER